MADAVDLQNHLYAALLDGKTADVALQVWGSNDWRAVYRLHRVILIRAGFFQSLFTAGFEESSRQHAIDVMFDDRNITRAAFEVCIARLYGGGPPLHVSTSLRPTPSHPLTPAFPHFSSPSQSDLPFEHHPATPRFLMSLLATALYLSIPSTASQALNLILNSIGPTTVLQYLNFALGKPIQDMAPDEPNAAVGLESLAESISFEESHPHEHLGQGCTPFESEGRIESRASAESSSPSESSLICSGKDPCMSGPLRHYGPVTDKIGEAAACWLARWAPDMLMLEELEQDLLLSLSEPGHDARSTPLGSGSSLHERPIGGVPTIWARGGLDAEWVSGLVSSDALFVRSEKDRYEFAKRVVEMRRKLGIDDTEEKVWERMFSDGIYYINMLMDDLITISEDISPTTDRPFVPLSVLQAANWSQSVLRHRIVTMPGVPPITSSQSAGFHSKGLGLSTAVTEIAMALADESDQCDPPTAEKTYFPIFGDCSVRLGDDCFAEGQRSVDQLSETPSHEKSTKPGFTGSSEATFFGLRAGRHHASAIVAGCGFGVDRWSPFPPLRFAVEFWDLDLLKEKNRLHSHTIWYAGSLFNVYVQVVHKKGIHLGVYLHRQSSIDPIPPSSAPSQSRGSYGSERPPKHGPSSPSSHSNDSRSPPPHPPSPSLSPTTCMPGSIVAPTYALAVTPTQPYRDPRASVLAYFAINSMSATGSSLTRFASAPDVFKIGQSWGWKSSYLRAGEYLDLSDAPGEGGVRRRAEVSFRATVVLGLA